MVERLLSTRSIPSSFIFTHAVYPDILTKVQRSITTFRLLNSFVHPFYFRLEGVAGSVGDASRLNSIKGQNSPNAANLL